MITAPVTPDEEKRLQSLYGYDILDTEAEQVFDDLTELASEICDTPIALISLVDPDRQWFKSTVGIDAQETHRDIAFCAHAIHQREIFEISDASKDERFVDNPLVTSDPSIRFYAGAQLVSPVGSAIGTLCVISDKPKELTKHQRKALEILSREVIAQMELRKNLKTLQAASDFKTEFLSNISHEIRTPLNAISGFSQLLLEECAKNQLPSVIDDYAQEINFGSSRLLNIVNSVLDLSKIEAGKMELSPQWFDAKKFITQLSTMMTIKTTEKSQQLNFDIDDSVPPIIYMDEGKLGQVLINLLNNSIKFTGEGKEIKLSAKCVDGQLILTVTDQGIGISKQDQSKLFNKYQQVGANKSKEGTGLGLCITKSLTELMGGSLLLTSEENIGTEVTIYIPLDVSQPAPIELVNSNITGTEISPHQILVVEDNPINRKLAKIMLESLGQILTFAETGEAAVEVVQQKAFDAIFMDIHMPGISGLEASRQIRALGYSMPIIALTADVFEIQKKDQDTFKFDDYLSKPITKDELTKSLCMIGTKK